LWKLLERREIESGLGEEALEEAGRIPRLNSYPMGSPRSRLESAVRVLPHRGEQEVTRAPQPGQEIPAEQRSDGR